MENNLKKNVLPKGCLAQKKKKLAWFLPAWARHIK